MSPERGGQETGEQLHSILAAELSRRWRWVERERKRDSNQILHDKVRTWYDSLGARGRDMSRLRAIRNKRGGLDARGRGKGGKGHVLPRRVNCSRRPETYRPFRNPVQKVAGFVAGLPSTTISCIYLEDKLRPNHSSSSSSSRSPLLLFPFLFARAPSPIRRFVTNKASFKLEFSSFYTNTIFFRRLVDYSLRRRGRGKGDSINEIHFSFFPFRMVVRSWSRSSFEKFNSNLLRESWEKGVRGSIHCRTLVDDPVSLDIVYFRVYNRELF